MKCIRGLNGMGEPDYVNIFMASRFTYSRITRWALDIIWFSGKGKGTQHPYGFLEGRDSRTRHEYCMGKAEDGGDSATEQTRNK